MTPADFCYWLQGVFEVGDIKQLDERQTAIVREHLGLVFTQVTGTDGAPAPAPSVAPQVEPSIAAEQAELARIKETVARITAARFPLVRPPAHCPGHQRFC